MKKRLLLILAGAALAISGYFVGRGHDGVVHAQGHVDIKKAYGKCVGAYSVGQGVGLVFEDNTGTIRIVNARDGNATTVYDRD
jgi:hypothetical protein